MVRVAGAFVQGGTARAFEELRLASGLLTASGFCRRVRLLMPALAC